MNFKEAIKESKKYYQSIFITSLSVLFSIIIALLLSYINYEVLGLFIFIFVSLPLLYGLLIYVQELIHNNDLPYNKIYKLFPFYFTRLGSGIFSVLLNSLFVFLIYDLGLNFYITSQIDPETLIELSKNMNIEAYQEIIEKVSTGNNYNLFCIVLIGIVSLFILYRVISRFHLPYINNFVFNSKLVFKSLPPLSKRKFKKEAFINQLPLIGLFTLGYIISAPLIYIFTKDLSLTLSLAIIIALILTFMYLPIYIISIKLLVNKFMIIIKETSKKITLQQINNRLSSSIKNSDEEKKLQELIDLINNEDKKDDEK